MSLITARPRRQGQGFTLLEVMVALAIFAVAAIALTRAGMSYTQGVSSLTDRTLAHFVAMNEAANLRILGTWPEGTGEKEVEEQGQHWLVQHQVYPTPSDNVRRVEIRIYPAPLATARPPTAQTTRANPVSSVVVFLRLETRS
ncbi:MAG: type secretion system protein GspI [Pseudomonadota bacterium]|jgi:general secretion pathway protein I